MPRYLDNDDEIKKFARIIVLIMVGIATGLPWMYCSGFLPHDLARGGESLVLADRAAGIITGLSAVYPGMGGSTGHRIGFAMLEGVSTGWRLLSAPGLFRESVKHDRRALPVKLGLKSWH
jgi:uncharacterized oligopeptide transporter (OPT) family protein